MEKRHNYVRKVAEVAVQCFITNDRPNVCGLVLAGSSGVHPSRSAPDPGKSLTTVPLGLSPVQVLRRRHQAAFVLSGAFRR